MTNTNFMPDDYISNHETRRINYIYLVLLLTVMTGLFGAFMAIKLRQKTFINKEKLVDEEMARKQKLVNKAEEIQNKSSRMLKTAMMTAELIEPLPRSILMALLTNSLPEGTSLAKLEISQKEISAPKNTAVVSKYNKIKSMPGQTPKAIMQTIIKIEGIAPSDLQVASYIENLSSYRLLENVSLVESKENKTKDTVFRQFKLNARVIPAAQPTVDDIQQIENSDISRILGEL